MMQTQSIQAIVSLRGLTLVSNILNYQAKKEDFNAKFEEVAKPLPYGAGDANCFELDFYDELLLYRIRLQRDYLKFSK